MRTLDSKAVELSSAKAGVAVNVPTPSPTMNMPVVAGRFNMVPAFAFEVRLEVAEPVLNLEPCFWANLTINCQRGVVGLECLHSVD